MKLTHLILAVWVASWTAKVDDTGMDKLAEQTAKQTDIELAHRYEHHFTKEFPTQSAAWEFLNHCPKGVCSNMKVEQK